MTNLNNHSTALRLHKNLQRGRVILYSIGLPIALAFSLATAAGSRLWFRHLFS